MVLASPTWPTSIKEDVPADIAASSAA